MSEQTAPNPAPNPLLTRSQPNPLRFAQSDFEGATVQYQNLLVTNPNNYVAMEKVVSLLRRAGKLSDVEEIFQNAEKKDPRASSHAGLYYSKGCYFRYTNNITDAVKNFNLARRDGEWGGRALESMVSEQASEASVPFRRRGTTILN